MKQCTVKMFVWNIGGTGKCCSVKSIGWGSVRKNWRAWRTRRGCCGRRVCIPCAVVAGKESAMESVGGFGRRRRRCRRHLCGPSQYSANEVRNSVLWRKRKEHSERKNKRRKKRTRKKSMAKVYCLRKKAAIRMRRRRNLVYVCDCVV